MDFGLIWMHQPSFATADGPIACPLRKKAEEDFQPPTVTRQKTTTGTLTLELKRWQMLAPISFHLFLRNTTLIRLRLLWMLLIHSKIVSLVERWLSGSMMCTDYLDTCNLRWHTSSWRNNRPILSTTSDYLLALPVHSLAVVSMLSIVLLAWLVHGTTWSIQ